jgi:hypothetical protein
VRRHRLSIALTLVLAFVLGWGVGLQGGGAATALVTLNVGHYRNANGVLVTVFSGTVSSDASGQTVDVLGQDCGVTGFRLIRGTHTRAGGGWRVENPLPDPPWSYTPVNSGVTYRARWNDQLSEPRVWATPAPLTAKRVGRRAWRVYTSPPPPGTVRMKGKRVELQRLTGGSWRTIQRKPLVSKPRLYYGGAFNHEAVFKIAQRGWRLRAVLPAESAAPCYLAGVTQEWRS